MKQILNYVIIGFIGLAILNGCKKKDKEEEVLPETKIIVNTTVQGLGKVQGVTVHLYLNNVSIGEKTSDSDGKVVFEDATPGYYYGSAYYTDSHNNDYLGQISTFHLSKDKTKERDVTLR